MLKFNWQSGFRVVLLNTSILSGEKEFYLDSSYPHGHCPGWAKLVSAILDK